MRLKKLLGEIMIGMGFVTRQQVDDALQRQRKIFEEKTVPERLKRARLVSQARLAIDRIPLLGKILTDMGFATNEQLEEALKEQNKMVEVYKSLESEKLGTTIEIGFIVNSTLDIAQVLALIMGYANRVTNSIASTLMLLDDKTGELVFSVPTGPKGDRLTDIRLPSGKGIAGWVAEHEEPALVPDAREDPRFYPEIDKISGFETKSILCVPLKAKTKLIGILEAINKTDGTSFTEEDTLLLNIFAYQAAMAIENARLYGELKDRLEEQILMQKKLAENITERKRVEEALRVSEERYRTLVETLTDIVFIVNPEGRFTYLNPEFEKIAGYHDQDFIGHPFTEILAPEYIESTVEHFKRGLSGEIIPIYEVEFKHKDGKTIPVELKVTTLLDAKGKSIGRVGVARDITARKQAEEALKRSEERYRTLFENNPIETITVDFEGRVTGFNKTKRKAAKKRPGDRLPNIGDRMYTEEYAGKHTIDMRAELMDCLTSGKSKEFSELEHNGVVWHTNIAPFPEGAIITSIDITARKQAQNKLTASLKEKEVLLKEVHHRVKNNMQVISSLLSLQSQHIKDKESLTMFQESQNRIRAMALIHEKLYTSEDLAHIDIAGYIHSLTHQLITTYRTIASRVNMDIAITDIFLTITTAIPCGLIINELVTNALKHAFPHQQKGTITVSMTPSTNDRLILTVSDTGIGFPKEIDFRNTTTLGMQLVTSLVEQLEGTITLDRSEGTRFRIKFRAQE
jgi:PAS domain S-box-containing protein